MYLQREMGRGVSAYTLFGQQSCTDLADDETDDTTFGPDQILRILGTPGYYV